LSARLVVPKTHVVAGQVISGQVVVHNNTEAAVRFVGCGIPFQVLLVSANYHPMPGWPACGGLVTIPIGQSSYEVQIRTTYDQCVAPPGSSPPDMPRCQPDGRPPPLPPGRYQATTFAANDAVPVPPPVTVRVIS
jgi:hypothetical protein